MRGFSPRVLDNLQKKVRITTKTVTYLVYFIWYDLWVNKRHGKGVNKRHGKGNVRTEPTDRSIKPLCPPKPSQVNHLKPIHHEKQPLTKTNQKTTRQSTCQLTVKSTNQKSPQFNQPTNQQTKPISTRQLF